jgi:hypothetical protein
VYRLLRNREAWSTIVLKRSCVNCWLSFNVFWLSPTSFANQFCLVDKIAPTALAFNLEKKNIVYSCLCKDWLNRIYNLILSLPILDCICYMKIWIIHICLDYVHRNILALIMTNSGIRVDILITCFIQCNDNDGARVRWWKKYFRLRRSLTNELNELTLEWEIVV